MSAQPSLTDVMYDLCSRFLLNCPVDDFESFERIFFHIEEAHWFYEDFYREFYPYLPSFKLRSFAEKMFNFCPLLHEYRTQVHQLVDQFQKYKITVPVNGAIILNESLTKALLVKGCGARSSWTFPRGKINKDEEDSECAIREVYEEIGYNIRDKLNKNHFLEKTIHDQHVKFFIITGVNENTEFKPHARNEIQKIEWVNLSDIPTRKPDSSPNMKNANNYYLVSTWMRQIYQWINQHRGSNKSRNSPKKYNNTGKRGSREFQSNNFQPNNYVESASQPENLNNTNSPKRFQNKSPQTSPSASPSKPVKIMKSSATYKKKGDGSKKKEQHQYYDVPKPAPENLAPVNTTDLMRLLSPVLSAQPSSPTPSDNAVLLTEADLLAELESSLSCYSAAEEENDVILDHFTQVENPFLNFSFNRAEILSCLENIMA